LQSNSFGVSRMQEQVRLSASSNALDESENRIFSEPPSAFRSGVEQIKKAGNLNKIKEEQTWQT